MGTIEVITLTALIMLATTAVIAIAGDEGNEKDDDRQDDDDKENNRMPGFEYAFASASLLAARFLKKIVI